MEDCLESALMGFQTLMVEWITKLLTEENTSFYTGFRDKEPSNWTGTIVCSGASHTSESSRHTYTEHPPQTFKAHSSNRIVEASEKHQSEVMIKLRAFSFSFYHRQLSRRLAEPHTASDGQLLQVIH